MVTIIIFLVIAVVISILQIINGFDDFLEGTLIIFGFAVRTFTLQKCLKKIQLSKKLTIG